ncbi:MAG: DUF3857 domain-containing protein [Bacteroidota bacterium]
MKKSLLYSSIFLFFSLSAHTQIIEDWGKVNPIHLRMETYEKDTAAEAVILFDAASIAASYENSSYEFRHHRRIKLLKSSSLDRGTIALPYYAKDDFELIRNIKAQSISPDGKRYPLEKADFFREKNEGGYSYVNFALPQLEVGSIIEYEYSMRGEDLVQLKEWYFQHDIPVLYSRLQFFAPDVLGYIYLFQGSEYLRKLGKDTYSYHGVGKLKISEKLYEMWDVPATKDERYMTSYNDYRARIRFQLDKVYGKSAEIGGKEEFYVRQSVLSSWEDLATKLKTHYNFGDQYLKKRTSKQVIESIVPLTTRAKTQKKKAQIVYDYLANNIEWNGYYGIFTSENLNKVFEKKTASRAEMNLMLLAVLRALEIEAYPLLTSTRGHGKLIPDHAIFDQFNYMFVQAKLDDKETFLDVGDPVRPMGYPEIDALNYKAWLVDGKASRWIDISVPTTRDVFQVKCNLEDNYLKGHVKTKCTGYSAVSERHTAAAPEQKEGAYWEERIATLSEDFSLSNFTTQNEQTLDQDFYAEFDFSIHDQVINNEDMLYISPILHSNFSENPFKIRKRYSDIDFPYQFIDTYLFELAIPAAYEIEQLPASTSIKLPNDGGRFRYTVSSDEEKITIQSNLKLSQRQFKAAEYPSIKTLFDLMIEKQGEQIVLRKVDR